MNKVLFSKKSDDWATPKWLYDYFLNKGFVDPCPLHCERDALRDEWLHDRYFINPPFSKIADFVDKVLDYANWATFVLLLPVRSDTRWFRKLADFGFSFLFFTKRLQFGGSKQYAPFPSCLAYCNLVPAGIHWCDADLKSLDGFFEVPFYE